MPRSHLFPFFAARPACSAALLVLAGSLAGAAPPALPDTQPADLARPDPAALIGRADVVRPSWPQPPLPLYQANGRFGCCFGPLGLHVRPDAPAQSHRFGRTQFMHTAHFVRARYNADYLLPLARLYWQDPPDPARLLHYHQRQSFYDGTVTTTFADDHQALTVTSWFDPVNADLAGLIIDVQSGRPTILLEPMTRLRVHYGQNLQQAAQWSDPHAGSSQLRLTCRDRSTTLRVTTQADLQVIDPCLRIRLRPGRNFLLLSVNGRPDTSAENSLARSKQWWHRTWQQSAWVDLPDPQAHRLWVRSVAYILCSTRPDDHAACPPCGLTGNAWPFPFPQDLSYLHPVLLFTGQLDTARHWIERWSADLPALQRYTRRLLKTDGVLMPWVYAYGPIDQYHQPSVPNINYYELHNSGYLARMAHETALMLDDPAWTARHADPLIQQTAAFFKSFCKKESDGYWHLFIEPSAGQDELGGKNQKDYLCALYSARYCFQTAIAHGLDRDGSLRRILHDGLAIPALKASRGYLYPCQGSGESDFGKQKHFTQLNPLTFLPIYRQPPPEVQVAYRLRYDINTTARKPFFYGWTGGQVLLASTRMGDPAGWRTDWNHLLDAHYFDDQLIQNYETSGHTAMSFYITTHGLLAQSLTDNLVCSWWGRLDIGRCLPWDRPVRFGNIRTPLGVTVEGRIHRTVARIRLTAWKDCRFELQDRTIQLEKGRSRTLALTLRH